MKVTTDPLSVHRGRCPTTFPQAAPEVGRVVGPAVFRGAMPKSRKRRPHSTSRRRRGSPRQTRPPNQPYLPGLQPWLGALARAHAAEARGDAAGALAVMADLPLGPDGEFFWSPGQVRRLGQLVDLGAVLPSWVTSRWVLSQAVRFLDRSRHGSAMRALGVAVGLRGGLHALPGVDEHDARARVVDSDWIYRQVLLTRRAASPTSGDALPPATCSRTPATSMSGRRRPWAPTGCSAARRAP